MKKNPPFVSITGMGVISPSGMGIESLWNACLNKQSLIQNGLGIIPENILPADNGKSLAMATYAITQAVNEAKWGNFTQDDVIIIGTTTGENELISYSTGVVPTPEGKIALRKQSLSSLSDDLKKTLKFPGRIIILASACSASTQAIVLAHDMLVNGRATRCLAGGVEELGKLTINGFGCLKLLNQDACKPFDQHRMGINLSEGAAFYSFEMNTQKPALAHILGGGTVLDSYQMTSPNPEGEGLQKAILTTLSKSQINADEISFVHAHGTGSSHNDQAESAALSKLFPHRPFVVSTKGVHGHALGASGSLELGICLQVLNKNIIPPVTGLDTVDENIKLNLPKTAQHTAIKYLLKTTLGFGGVNSAFILKAANNA
jgi:3-oxoacyl-(acyl-carrier-protein) synthase